MPRRWIGQIGAVMGVGVLCLSGCASSPPPQESAMSKALAPIPQEQAVSKALAPMPQPERAIGYKVVRIRNGREEVNALVAQTAETQTWADSSGCRAVLPRTGFGPALEFSNCDGSTGTQTVQLASGSPYPLALGSKWRHSYAETNTRADRWTGQRHCAVEGTVRVKAGATEVDTYKVVCEDNAGNAKTTHTHYVAPELQATVLQERYRVRNWPGAPPPDRTTWEFIRQE